MKYPPLTGQCVCPPHHWRLPADARRGVMVCVRCFVRRTFPGSLYICDACEINVRAIRTVYQANYGHLHLCGSCALPEEAAGD